MPSAELFFICGNHDLEHLTEELDAVWTKCSTLAGPQPKPHLAIGLMSSAFTDKEILKLKSYTAPDRATLFTEHVISISIVRGKMRRPSDQQSRPAERPQRQHCGQRYYPTVSGGAPEWRASHWEPSIVTGDGA